jgi:hypothetical protein
LIDFVFVLSVQAIRFLIQSAASDFAYDSSSNKYTYTLELTVYLKLLVDLLLSTAVPKRAKNYGHDFGSLHTTDVYRCSWLNAVYYTMNFNLVLSKVPNLGQVELFP